MTAALLALALLAPRPAAAALSTSTLVVCDDVQDPASLNPYQIFSEKTLTILQQMLEGLVRFDVEGKVEPALATSWERVSETAMRFHLRKGVYFHDGEPFNARAVKFSLEKYVAPETHYPGVGFVGTISSVAVVDDYTVDVITHHPDGLLLNRLAAWVHIMPPQYYEKVGDQGFSQNPIGTGAFKFDHWEHGKAIELVRNGGYWNQDEPKVGHLTFKFIPSEKLLGALKSGEIDLASELPGTMTTLASQSGSIKVIKKLSFYTVTAAFNTERGPLKNQAVRQALNYGINKQDLIRYDLLGNGREIATVTMSGEEGHNAALSPYPYDERKARKMLKEAGYPHGFTLKVAAKMQGARAAQIIATQLKKIGITLDLNFFSDADLGEALKREPWDMLLAGCPDPMAHSFFIQSIFLYSASPYSLAKNPEYDSRLEAMSMTLDDVLRERNGAALDRYMYDQALMLFMYQRIKTYGVRENVAFTPSVTGMSYFFDTRKSELP